MRRLASTTLIGACAVGLLLAACGGDDGGGGNGGNGAAGGAGGSTAGSAGDGGNAGNTTAGNGGAGAVGGAAGAGAAGGAAGNAGAGGTGGAPNVLPRASRSSTVALTGDDATVVMANQDCGGISIFDTASNTLRASVPTGGEPSSVVIHPNDTSVFVANRADATVVRVDGIDGTSPTAGTPVAVGSEPTGLALSPTGKLLFVAEHAEGSIAVIDTATMQVVDRITGVDTPYALAVTNDLDTDDSDELLVVPEFFGEAIGVEGTDESRQGRVRFFNVSDLTASGQDVLFQPVDSGFEPKSTPGAGTAMTSPNQLSSVNIQGDKLYITSISVSPNGPPTSNGNVQPVIYAANISDRTIDTTHSVNLARAVKTDAGSDPILFLADIVDVDFIAPDVAYVASRGADVIQRVGFGPTVTVGHPNGVRQMDILQAPATGPGGCKNPTGIVAGHASPKAWVNCWVSRSLGVMDFTTQTLAATIKSCDLPTNPNEQKVQDGKRFFFTGRARWSDNAWSSCSSCHPGGLSDNVVWRFAAGPRKSVSLAGSYSHGPGANQKQRIFNHTAVFDEMHDFNANTVGVQGGAGAIQEPDTGAGATDCSGALKPTALGDGVKGVNGKPAKEFQDAPENCGTKDFDAIEAWAKQIRPPAGKKLLDPNAVARGAVLFGEFIEGTNSNGGCVSCHGGPGWTVSRRFYTPSTATNTALGTAVFTAPPAWPSTWTDHSGDFQLSIQNAASDNVPEAQGPNHVSCVIRKVGTFGVPGDAAATSTLEVRANGTTRAQGRGGYNIPSLYGLSLGAPFFHHGGAKDLEEMFTGTTWEAHYRAVNAAFLTGTNAAQDREDLIQFLLSIDSSTTEQPIPFGFDGCPTAF